MRIVPIIIFVFTTLCASGKDNSMVNTVRDMKHDIDKLSRHVEGLQYKIDEVDIGSVGESTGYDRVFDRSMGQDVLVAVSTNSSEAGYLGETGTDGVLRVSGDITYSNGIDFIMLSADPFTNGTDNGQMLWWDQDETNWTISADAPKYNQAPMWDSTKIVWWDTIKDGDAAGELLWWNAATTNWVLSAAPTEDYIPYWTGSAIDWVEQGSNQVIDRFDISSDTLYISLSSDEEADKSVSLSPYLDNTDDQVIDKFSLSGNTISLSIENDGEADKTIDLSAYKTNVVAADVTGYTNITVITDFKYDFTSHQLQVKTRSVNILGSGAESGWGVVTGGQAEAWVP